MTSGSDTVVRSAGCGGWTWKSVVLLVVLFTGCTPPPDGAPPRGAEGVEYPVSAEPNGSRLSAAPPPATSEAGDTDGWSTGIVQRSHPLDGVAILTGTRVGENEGFDRIVLEYDEAEVGGYRIEYIDGPAFQCGSGLPVEIAGERWLLVRLQPTHAHTEEGIPTITERSLRPDLPVIREMRMICDFEGMVEWAVGVASMNPFRVLELREPGRLVIDVRW